MDSIRRHNLYRTQPTHKWIEAIPCGNGTLGAMAWGGPEELILSLDRSDLWYDCPSYRNRRIMAGALILRSSMAEKFAEGLDLHDAVAFRETGSSRFEWFVHARQPVLCIRVLSASLPVRFPARQSRNQTRNGSLQRWGLITNSGLSR